MKRIKLPPCFKVGRGTYFAGRPTVLWDRYGSTVTVGNYSAVADRVTFFLGGHHHTEWLAMTAGENRRSSSSKGSIRIGSDCWIGHGAVIMDNVRVGDGAVVGAYSVVASDVPSYAVVVGNPMRVVKFRFDKWTRDRLLQICWWNWEPDKVLEALPLLRISDPRPFLEKYGGLDPL